MISLTKDKRVLGREVLTPHPGISCFVTIRHGGCSTGNYTSFNCAPYTGDHSDYVRKNQELLCAALPSTLRELAIPFQAHGISSLITSETYPNTTHSERQPMLRGADTLITRTSHYCICTSTADCIPILLYDKEHHATAAVHVDWRGTIRCILAHTLRRIQATCDTGGKNIIACIGPGAFFASFEVGDEVYEAFHAEGFPMEQIFAWRPGAHKHHINLWRANHLQLFDFGVSSQQIGTAGIYTYWQHEDLFSTRRLGIRLGHILSGIMLNGQEKWRVSEIQNDERQT